MNQYLCYNISVTSRLNKQVEAIERTIASNKEEMAKQKQLGRYNSTYVIDEAMGKKYLSFIERITTSVNRNPAIFSLVKEEAAAYFSGRQSAEDISRTIQDRVTTLLQETQ